MDYTPEKLATDLALVVTNLWLYEHHPVEKFRNGLRQGIAACEAIEQALTPEGDTFIPGELPMRRYFAGLVYAYPTIKPELASAAKFRQSLKQIIESEWKPSEDELTEMRDYFGIISNTTSMYNSILHALSLSRKSHNTK